MSALPNIGDTQRAIELARRVIARWANGVAFVGSADEQHALEQLAEIARTHVASRRRKENRPRVEVGAVPTFERPSWSTTKDAK